MGTHSGRERLMLVCALAALALSGCELITGWFNPDKDADSAIEPELAFTPEVPAVSGDASRVVVRGSVNGQTIYFEWDFQPINSVTNGAMQSQISSTLPDSASFYLDNDFSAAQNPQSTGDWYLRFTLGNLRLGDTVFNAKDTFAIPERPYAMITLRKGPDGDELRHREYDADNLLCIQVTQAVYDADAKTFRLAGGLKATWGTDWVTADFSVLYGGPDDRYKSFNAATLAYAFE